MTKIMLVEDDNNLREIYQARLEAEGYEIVSAMDGEAALAIASKELPDLVISDVMMPKISGFEMLDILRNTEALKDVKIIMLTALGQTEDSTRASNLGANRYLVKSQVTLEDIVKAAHDLLDGTPGAPPALTPVSLDGHDKVGPYSNPEDNEAYNAPKPQPVEVPTQPQTQAAESTDTPVARLAEQPSAPAGPVLSAGQTTQAADDDSATPTLNVVEPPAEESDDAPAAAAPMAEPPALPESEAEVQEAAPLPAAQEEAAINDQIKDFISSAPATSQAAPPAAPSNAPAPETPEASAVPASPPALETPESEPATQATDGPVATAQPPSDTSTPAPGAPAAPAQADLAEDLADFEPAPEMLDVNAPPKIIDEGPAVPPADTASTPPSPSPTPSYNKPLPSDQPDADREMASAISGLTPGGEAEDAPSGQPNAEAPGNRSIPVNHMSSDAPDMEDDTPKKKVITPIHDLSDRPDLNKLLQLEDSKAAAQQAARNTDPAAPAAPGQNPQQTPGGTAPQQPPAAGQQPFSAPAIDPNSISL